MRTVYATAGKTVFVGFSITQIPPFVFAGKWNERFGDGFRWNLFDRHFF